MTKRQRHARIRQIQRELIDHMRQQFPKVELIRVDERPSGTIALEIYVPYEEPIDVLDSVVLDRVVELLDKEKLDILVLPLAHKPRAKRRAA